VRTVVVAVSVQGDDVVIVVQAIVDCGQQRRSCCALLHGDLLI
jgi:hypothetical protein